jgi:hypothetical protein
MFQSQRLILFFILFFSWTTINSQIIWEPLNKADSLFFSSVYYNFSEANVYALDPNNYHQLLKGSTYSREQIQNGDTTGRCQFEIFRFRNDYYFQRTHFFSSSVESDPLFTYDSLSKIIFLKGYDNGWTRIYLNENPYLIHWNSNYQLQVFGIHSSIYDSKRAPKEKFIRGLQNPKAYTLIYQYGSHDYLNPLPVISIILGKFQIASGDSFNERRLYSAFAENIPRRFPKWINCDLTKGDSFYIAFRKTDFSSWPKEGDTMTLTLDKESYTDSLNGIDLGYYTIHQNLNFTGTIDTVLYFASSSIYEEPLIDPDYYKDMKWKSNRIYPLLHPRDSNAYEHGHYAGKTYRKFKRYKFFHGEKKLTYKVYSDPLLLYLYENKKRKCWK